MAGTFRGHTFNALMQPNAVDDRPLAFRSTLAPFGTYANPDGSESFGFAWPAAVTEPINALQRLAQNSYTEDGRLGIPDPRHPENLSDMETLLWTGFGSNALKGTAGAALRPLQQPTILEQYHAANNLPHPGYGYLQEPVASTAEDALRWVRESGPIIDGELLSDTGKPSLMGSAVAGAEGNALGPYERSMIDYLKSERINPAMPQWSNEWQRIKAGETKRYPELNASLLENELARLDSEAASFPGVQDMGWNEGFKHGTKELSPIEQMRPSSDGHLGPGVYVTRRNALAKEYADHGGTPGRIVNMEVRGDALDANQWQAIIENIASGTGKPLESQAVYDAAKNQLRKYGYTGIKSNQGFSVVFDPEDLRPANGAAFFSDTGKPSLMGAAVAGENARPGITAYHGSPHDFDKFSLDKIGTGEGAQAYGHGLYFAENEGVAKQYAHKLADRPTVSSGGSSQFAPDSPEAIVSARLSDYTKRRRMFGDDPTPQDAATSVMDELDRHISVAAQNNDFDTFKSLSDQRLALERMNEAGIEMNRPGKTYQVRINADPNDFLDWDKPLGQQSEKVKGAFNNLEFNDPDPRINDQLRYLRDNGQGSEIMSLLSHYAKDGSGPTFDGWGASASNHLREAGIPGIRYLDQMSRTAGDGSRNYVVFDDSLIEILKKYGLAGGVLGASSLFDFNTDQQY